MFESAATLEDIHLKCVDGVLSTAFIMSLRNSAIISFSRADFLATSLS
jgi:hypothetical protein